ncbi:MAG: hypothetical protein IJ908_09235 [Fibrobacter sp.]|nr:hypothetical protein [Fibrobacter sp.]
MLKKILDVEPENAETSSNESLDLLPENAAEIQGEGDSDFDRDVRGETLPAVVHEEPPKTEKLDAVTAGALQLRYRIFNATNDDVRMATDVNGMTWFVADDVCKVLGYKNTAKAVADHCRKVFDSKDLVEGENEICKKMTFKDANGHSQAMIAINEPDLYRLIVRSRMPAARVFEKWVFEIVLPTLRIKKGRYVIDKKIELPPKAEDATTVAPAEEPVQCELFPNMMPSMTFPKPLTEKINAAKLKLYNEGHTFPNNKEFVKFLITRALDQLE